MNQHIQFCTTPDGTRIAFTLTGEGPPLIRVINWASHLKFEEDSPVWRHWVEAFSRHHTFIRYDGRGFGLSDLDAADLSFAAWVQDLETVVDYLGLEQVSLLGLCRGAFAAVAYAVQHPEKVNKLVLYGGYTRGRFVEGTTKAQRDRAEMFLNLVRYGWGNGNAAFRQVYTHLFMPDGSPEQMQWLTDLQRVSTRPEIAVRLQLVSYSLDISHLTCQVRVPTLVLHAVEDALVPFRQGLELAAQIPDAQFVPLDTRNHMLLEQEPAWKKFVQEVYAFLGVPAAAAQHASPAEFNQLTDRECEVLDLLAQGLDNAGIAEQLVLSPKTVRNHVTHIYQKIHAESRAQAVVRAREAGFGIEQRILS